MTAAEAAVLRQDVAVVLAHVAHDANGHYLLNHSRGTTLRILKHSLPRFGCGEAMTGEHLANLEKVVGWVCFQMDRHRNYRRLTPDESHVQASAWRLSEALYAARVSG